MEVTSQYWTVASVGLFLAVWGMVVADPLVFLGSGAVAAWLLARQYRFVRVATRAESDLTVDVATQCRVSAEETYRLSLETRLDRSLPLTVDVSVTPPVGATGEPASVTLVAGDQRAVARTAINWPVAGSFTIDDSTAVVTDGLFRQSIDLGSELTVRVNPRAPDEMHVGQGGDPIATGFGDHKAGRLGTSTESAEVREYVPGDAVRQIDWKATARLDHPHVQEFEAGVDRETVLLFDHRSGMADGRPGARKLDYARQFAMAFLDQTRELGDRLGYYAVGDEGLTRTVSPAPRVDIRAHVHEHLLDVSPTESIPTTDEPMRSATARAVTDRLAADDSPFGRTLTPFFDARQSYRRRFDSLPLYQAVTTARFSSGSLVRTVVITDDTNRAELREVVDYARQHGDRVAVFLTPTTLFDTTDLTDLDGAYDRYVDFEEFRRELAGFERVDAFEVGPADRLSAVLSAGRERRTRGNV